MGYEVHFAKKGNWFDDDAVFTQGEWDTLCEEDGLADMAYFSDGRISAKNPSRDQLVRLIAIATQRGWSVQGDDGEKYGADGLPIPERGRPGLIERLSRPFREARAGKQIAEAMAGVVPPFEVGDRVRTVLGKTGGIVVKVDPRGNHGAGLIRVKFADGSEESALFIAHGYEKG